MTTALHRLSEIGQSIWIDYLSRDLLERGELERLVRESAVVGVTSNPTIFQHALAHSEAYDAQLRELATSALSPKDRFLELACRDVELACDLLQPVWERSRGRDGWVSIEVDPNLACNTAAQSAEAARLHDAIARPNAYVKIPATLAGLAAVEDSIAAGRSINVTLIFSIDRYVEVARAYLKGLVRLRAAGGDLGSVRSVASFFVSRIDTETDGRLERLEAPQELKGRLGIASARLVYARYREIFSPRNDGWRELAAAGAHPQRCLWASTSTKNPAYRDVRYVEELIGPDTVNTMPEATLRAFADHGVAAPTLERGLAAAHLLFDRLARAGLEYDAVVEQLERDGVATFVASFAQLLAGLDAKTEALGEGTPRIVERVV
jgi:transaldolase